jgi:hypothetical protein
VSWLGLHPQEIADRARQTGLCKTPPGVLAPVALGSIGFMFVSVAGFASKGIWRTWETGMIDHGGFRIWPKEDQPIKEVLNVGKMKRTW